MMRARLRPPEGDSRFALNEFIGFHGSALREYAVVLARGDETRADDFEQVALIEVWMLDPARYARADWPFLVEAGRRAMRTLLSRWWRKQRELILKPGEAEELRRREQPEYMRRAERGDEYTREEREEEEP